MYDKFTPQIIIKKIADNSYKWALYLSPNKDRPSCVGPKIYTEAFKCRESAYEFAKKLKGPIRLKDRCESTEETLADGDVVIIDETKVKSADRFVNADIH